MGDGSSLIRRLPKPSPEEFRPAPQPAPPKGQADCPSRRPCLMRQKTVSTTLNPLYTGYISHWGAMAPVRQGLPSGVPAYGASDDASTTGADTWGRGNNDEWLPIAPDRSAIQTQDEREQRQRQAQGRSALTANGQISLNTILQDFKSTLDTIQAQDGTTPAIKGEVQTYLQTVNLLGQKPSPSAAFIRQTLKTAAQSLDDFIGNALNQPSTVVGDWLDALLSQDIEYKTDGSVQFNPDAAQANLSTDGTAASTHAGALSTEQQQQLKTWLTQSQAATQAQDWPQALATLQQAINVFPADSPHPALAKLQKKLGQTYLKANQPDEALAAWQQATASYASQGLWDKALPLTLKAARLADKQGQPMVANQLLEQAARWNAQLDSPLVPQAELLNQMGLLKFSQNNAASAIPHFEQAVLMARASVTQSATTDVTETSDLLPDLLSNLGAAYRQTGQLKQSALAYERSLRAADILNQSNASQLAREQLASVYLQARQPHKALALLQAS
jgi:tetratricopeptide (TPR) repeat protein